MSHKHQRLNPQHIAKDKTWWFYEEPEGITVVVEPSVSRNGLATRVLRIPWKVVRAALARKDQKP